MKTPLILLTLVTMTACQAASTKSEDTTVNPAVVTPPANGADAGPGPSRADVVANQVLVSFKSGNNRLAREAIAKQYGATEVEKVGTQNLYLFQLPVKSDMTRILEQIKLMPQVKYAEPNLRMHIMQQKPAASPGM